MTRRVYLKCYLLIIIKIDTSFLFVHSIKKKSRKENKTLKETALLHFPKDIKFAK